MALARSWVESANNPETEFPLNNLPIGRYLDDDQPTLCVALGDRIVDLRALERTGHLSLGDHLGDVFQTRPRGGIAAFMEAGPEVWSTLRARLTDLFSIERGPAPKIEACLKPMDEVRLVLPFDVAEFTDFYSGRHHATNVGTMFRGADHALPPNWLHMPSGYNGRASSVVVSGTPVTRPMGQLKGPDDALPRFAASQRFDFELEMGAIVGQPSEGPLGVAQADAAIFGYVLLNDWSARDIQAWEYQPLGPFQAKATATTISPWIVMAGALDPFRTMPPPREVPLLPYIADDGPMLYDIALYVGLTPEGGTETVVTRTNFSEMYFSPAQQLAHHASSGCPMRVGDLIGSGTISGPQRENRGSMLELSWGGTQPVAIDGGTRHFLEDGDTVTLRGHAQGDGFRIGFGACRGTVMPAREVRA